MRMRDLNHHLTLDVQNQPTSQNNQQSHDDGDQSKACESLCCQNSLDLYQTKDSAILKMHSLIVWKKV